MTKTEKFAKLIEFEPRLRDVYDWAVERHTIIGVLNDAETTEQAAACSELKSSLRPLVGDGRNQMDGLHTEDAWDTAIDYLRWVLIRDCYDSEKPGMRYLP